MLAVEEALKRIYGHIKPLGTETVPLRAAANRVLAEPVIARHNQPPFDSSAMDGYAVRAAEAGIGRSLTLAGTAQAGQRFVGMMDRGQCVRIFTGAPLPIGADAVVMQEETEVHGNQISFLEAVRVGQSVRRQGNDFKRGDALIAPGTLLTPARISLAAASNLPELVVNRRPRIAILSSGDELVQPGSSIGADQIVSSNNFGLAALLSPFAERVVDLGIVRDDPKAIEAALLSAFDDGIDVLITSGGASVGDRDYMQEVLKDLGVAMDFWKLRMRPGKPLMFGVRGRTLIFGLPGNPVSAMATAHVVVKPTLKRIVGLAETEWPRFTVALAGPLPANGPRRHYLRGKLIRNDFGMLEVDPISETDSGHISSLAASDCFIVQPENDEGRSKGSVIEVIPLDWG
ncbi:molybdopterin molybdotransferase [Devosia enhydra]|uniref:Molybdopterin molybdenumtransferase n=1 Tax=Devosia enhydra TaxID=665118 RepID=A0A1K2HW42_9HYPH|nr:gephyrin-like molybdotransferase Glp [Devosia enhydra]SFZ82176.1 molybdopterin molybdotransferase [Devosia enhydra]